MPNVQNWNQTPETLEQNESNLSAGTLNCHLECQGTKEIANKQTDWGDLILQRGPCNKLVSLLLFFIDLAQSALMIWCKKGTIILICRPPKAKVHLLVQHTEFRKWCTFLFAIKMYMYWIVHTAIYWSCKLIFPTLSQNV